MTTDIVEAMRRRRLIAVNTEAADRRMLEQRHGQVWDPSELRRDFIVTGFLAPYVGVTRKLDGVVGSLEFQHEPRFYFNWQEDR